MNQTTSPAVPALVLRRTYAVSPERLYAAWTDPAQAQRFICPDGVSVPEIALDVRVGGAYRIVMDREDGERFIVRGVYREVVPNAKLVMTWRWEEDDPRAERDTLLTVELLPHAGGTELVLTHAELASLESRERHEHGWTSVLAKLDGV